MRLFTLLLLMISTAAFSQPANDDCVNAISLTPSSNTACTTTAGTNVDVVSADYDGCAEFEKRNVWYKFTATSSTHIVQLTLNTMTQGIVDVYGGSCGSFVNINAQCSFGQSGPTINRVLSGLTPGTEYFIAVSTREQSEEGTFSICVTTPTPPANDDCSNSVSLAVNPSNVPVNKTAGTTQFATQSLPGCSGTADDDVWYSFTATQTSHRIFLQAPVQQGSLINAVAQVFSGSCGSLTPVQCINNFNATVSQSQLAVGLTPGQTYFLRVYSSNAPGSGAGSFTIAITSLPQNDNCSGAVNVTPPATGTNACSSSVAGSTFDATQSTPDCFGGNATSNDTWFKFTATQEVHEIKVFGFGSNSVRFEVLQGACAGLTNLFCGLPDFSGDTALTKIGGLTTGQEYYVRVYSGNSGGIEGLFNVCITSPLFPANDACNNAVVLTPSADSTINFINGSLVGSTNVQLSGASCNTVGKDVWYRFTATSIQHVIALQEITDFSSLTIEAFSGTCNTRVHLRCSFLNDSLFGLGNLVVGDTYLVRINSNSVFSPETFRIAVFTPQPLANDECSGALPLTVSTDGSCVLTGGINLGATQSATDACGLSSQGNIRDVWYHFTASSASQRIGLTRGTANGLYFQLYSGSCGSLTSLGCSQQLQSSLLGASVDRRYDGLTPGDTYYIRVFSRDPDPEGTFDICVRQVVIPANNDCSTPTVLLPQSSFAYGSFTSASTFDATQSSQPTQCSIGQDDDVWFQFTATASRMKLYLDNRTIGITRMAVYSGDCAALTLVRCQTGTDRDNSVVLPNLTVGTVYLVRVYSSSTSGGQGRFGIMLTTDVAAQPNDDCNNATLLVPSTNTSCTETSGSTVDALASGNTSCVNGNEVWYRFVATAASHRVNVQGFVDAPVVTVFNGSCAALTALPSSCAFGSLQVSVTVSGLTVGTTYFIKMLPNSTGGFAQANFSICVTTPQAPANDACAAATVLSVLPDASDVVLPLQTNHLATAIDPPNLNQGPDVWYSFTAPVEPVVIEVNAPSKEVYLELFSGDCGSLTAIEDNSEGSGADTKYFNVMNPQGLVAGEVYRVRVSSNVGTAGPTQFTIKVYKALSAKLNTAIDTTCLGSNLVQNPSFERDFAFPTIFTFNVNPGQEIIPGWRVPSRGTADFLNARNAPGSSVEVPFNSCFGSQSARTGKAYAGFFAYTAGGTREYLENALLQPMLPGQRYLVSMNVNLADYSNIAVDNLGMALRTSSTAQFTSSNLSFTPQVVSADGVFLTNKEGWVNISAVITADQAYTHLLIGNFKNNAATDTVRVADPSGGLGGGSFGGCGIPGGEAYYLVDDVVVSEISGGAGCGVLPLQWLGFNGWRKENVVQLNWRTANEQNTSHFDVERSADGARFTSIATKQAANRSGEHSYDLIDQSPLKGWNYYRLKQVDQNGRFVYSSVVRVRFDEGAGIQLYPQPVTSTLQAVCDGMGEKITIQIFDASGKLCNQQRRQNRGTLSLDVSSLGSGVYWMLVSDGVTQQKASFLKQ